MPRLAFAIFFLFVFLTFVIPTLATQHTVHCTPSASGPCPSCGDVESNCFDGCIYDDRFAPVWSTWTILCPCKPGNRCDPTCIYQFFDPDSHAHAVFGPNCTQDGKPIPHF